MNNLSNLTKPRSLEVNIDGQNYFLKLGETHDVAYLKELADNVDKKIKEIKKFCPSNVAYSNLLMLTCLNLAEDVLLQSSKNNDAEKIVEESLSDIKNKLKIIKSQLEDSFALKNQEVIL